MKKQCVLCGKEGHSSHECPYQRLAYMPDGAGIFIWCGISGLALVVVGAVVAWIS